MHRAWCRSKRLLGGGGAGVREQRDSMCRELASFDVSEVRREVLEIGEMQLFFLVVRRELVSNKTTRKRRARTCGNAEKKKKRPAAYLLMRRELRVTDQAESQ